MAVQAHQEVAMEAKHPRRSKLRTMVAVLGAVVVGVEIQLYVQAKQMLLQNPTLSLLVKYSTILNPNMKPPVEAE